MCVCVCVCVCTCVCVCVCVCVYTCVCVLSLCWWALILCVCVCRRSFLMQRRSPSPPSSTATQESAKPPPRPPPPPPRPASPPPPPAQRPLSAKHRERTIINMPSEQIRDEIRIKKPPPPVYEIGSQTDRHLLDDYDQVSKGFWGVLSVFSWLCIFSVILISKWYAVKPDAWWNDWNVVAVALQLAKVSLWLGWVSKLVTWCFMPSRPLRLYQGEWVCHNWCFTPSQPLQLCQGKWVCRSWLKACMYRKMELAPSLTWSYGLEDQTATTERPVSADSKTKCVFDSSPATDQTLEPQGETGKDGHIHLSS